jgi:hypothetical protein
LLAGNENFISRRLVSPTRLIGEPILRSRLPAQAGALQCPFWVISGYFAVQSAVSALTASSDILDLFRALVQRNHLGPA